MDQMSCPEGARDPVNRVATSGRARPGGASTLQRAEQIKEIMARVCGVTRFGFPEFVFRGEYLTIAAESRPERSRDAAGFNDPDA